MFNPVCGPCDLYNEYSFIGVKPCPRVHLTPNWPSLHATCPLSRACLSTSPSKLHRRLMHDAPPPSHSQHFRRYLPASPARLRASMLADDLMGEKGGQQAAAFMNWIGRGCPGWKPARGAEKAPLVRVLVDGRIEGSSEGVFLRPASRTAAICQATLNTIPPAAHPSHHSF